MDTTASAELIAHISEALGIDINSIGGIEVSAMDVDEMSVPDSPLESGEPSADPSSMERQLATLQTYLKHLPYQTESVEEMQQRLEYIVGKITVCAKAKSWLLLTTWDGALQWCVPIHLLL